MDNLTKKCLDRMDTISTGWFIGHATNDPLLLKMWCMVSKQSDNKHESIGIDSRMSPPVIKFNPNFINAVSDEVLETVMVIECFKLLLKHATGRIQRPIELSGLSSQITIDELLKKEFEKLISVKQSMPMAKDFKLPEQSYKEHYFKLLAENFDSAEKTLNTLYGKPEEQSEGNDSTDDSKNSEGNSEGNGYKEFKNEQDALNNYFDPRNTNSSQWGENENFEGEVGQMIADSKLDGNVWGKYSENAVSQILAAHEPKITVREILRRFRTSITSKKSYLTRMKANRRFDLDYMGRRYEDITKILLAGDSSGSMSDEDISYFFALVNSVCKHAKLDFMLWDTEIKLVEKNFKKARSSFKVNGRGGTNPQLVLKYADEHNYDGVVIFSDMYFDDDLRKPKTPVLWLGTNKSSPNTIPWGFHAKLDR